jgi:hypothetical protein
MPASAQQTRRPPAKKPTPKAAAKKPAAEAPPKLPELPNDRLLAVGDKGILGGLAPKIVQVIDENNALAEVSLYSRVLTSGPRGPEHKESRVMVWMKLPTAGLVDGFLLGAQTKEYSTRIFEVTGTKTYKTALGTKTVMVLAPAPAPMPATKPDGPTAKPEPNAVAAPAATAAKGEWLNESYKTTLRHVKDEEWAEFDNATGRVHLRYVEKARTDEYLEVFCPERNQELRFYAKRAELKKNGKWEWVAKGHWLGK